MTPRTAAPTGSTRADSYTRDAARLAQRGDFAAAETAATFALALAPSNPVALRISGSVQRKKGHHDLAEEQLRAAVAIDPTDLLARRELAACLGDRGRIGDAIRLLLDPPPNDAESWFDLGVLHDRNADAQAALEAARTVSRLAPRHVGAQFLVARALTSLGDIEAAAAVYRQLARLPAQAAKAWFALLDLKTIRITSDELRLIEQLESNPRSSEDDRTLAAFALGQAYEMADRPVDAVRAFDGANRRRRRQTPWDAQAYSRTIDAIRAAFPDTGEPANSERGAEAIFVLGMPRSGTTLIEQILAAHPEVVGASELPDIGLIISEESRRRGKTFPSWAGEATEHDWERLGEDYRTRTRRWRTRTRFTDKMPENWLYVGAILRMLPGARIIGCERSPIETAWSCYKQMFAPGQLGWSYDIDSVAAYTRDSRRLWQHFQRNEPRRCRTQSYEAVLVDLEAQTRGLLQFVGLAFHPDCLDFASARRETRSASAAQVRQPLNTATARRAKYGAALAPLVAALERAEKANSD